MAATRRQTIWPRLSLGYRLMAMLAVIICLILLGQAILTVSAEMTNLDRQMTAQGTILAMGVASSASVLMDGDNPQRFDGLLEQLSRKIDVVEMAIVDKDYRVLGHSDPKRVGEVWSDENFGLFDAPRTRPGLSGILSGQAEYHATAPVLRGRMVVGFVVLKFRSREVLGRAAAQLRSIAIMGLFWLALGGAMGIVYVRRITRPLGELTRAATAITEGRLDDAQIQAPTSRDEIGTLQGSFGHLLEALRREQAANRRLLGELQDMNVLLRQRVDEVTADLRETTAYLRSVIHCMEEGVITCNGTGEIVQSNKGAFEQLRGLGQPEPGSNIREAVPDGEALAEAVQRAIGTGEASTVQIVRRCTEGPWRDWHPADAQVIAGRRTLVFRVHPLQSLEGSALGAVITVLDETNSRRVEARMRRHDRMISLGTIAAGLAHELGNYMHAINGFSGLLLRNLPEDDPRRQDAQAIHDENTAAVELLDRFLLFARPSTLRFKPERLNAVVRDALEMCAYRLRVVSVSVVDSLDPDDPEVNCDAHLLTQVFINLTLNAIDAMENQEKRQLTVASRLADEQHLEIVFRDTGSGISSEIVERVFDPFFTTKESGGTGLGLSIVHQIITLHEGTITVASQEGVGTRFTIALPTAGPEKREP